jgi:flagellar protein FlaI
MAIDDTGGGDEQAASGVDVGGEPSVSVGDYSWSDFRREEDGEGRFERAV